MMAEGQQPSENTDCGPAPKMGRQAQALGVGALCDGAPPRRNGPCAARRLARSRAGWHPSIWYPGSSSARGHFALDGPGAHEPCESIAQVANKFRNSPTLGTLISSAHVTRVGGVTASRPPGCKGWKHTTQEAPLFLTTEGSGDRGTYCPGEDLVPLHGYLQDNTRGKEGPVEDKPPQPPEEQRRTKSR